MKRALLLLPALLAGPAIAQAPPPVPALPDSPRMISYSLSGSNCACSLGFALYGDGTDVDNWIDVILNGTSVQSTDPAHGWSLSSATGALGSIPRPITNAVLTFAAPQTGTVTIIGARRPRRLTQFQEGRGVTARDLNQAMTDQVAMLREAWDLVRGTTPPIPTTPSGAVNADRFTSGLTVYPNATFDIAPTTAMPPASYQNPVFNFNDLTMAGATFPNSQAHIAFAITSNKQPTAAVGNANGTYEALNVTQNCSGSSQNDGTGAGAFCLGALLQSVANYNPNGWNFGFYGASNPQIVVPNTSGCSTCGSMSINSVIGEEIDLFIGQPVFTKEGLRIVDYSASTATNADTGNTSAIHILKAPVGNAPGWPSGSGNPVGWPIGININSNWNGSAYNDNGYPIAAGGKAIFSVTTAVQLQCFLCLDQMAAGFTGAAITVPTATQALWFGPTGAGGRIASNGTGLVSQLVPTTGTSGNYLCINSSTGALYQKSSCP